MGRLDLRSWRAGLFPVVTGVVPAPVVDPAEAQQRGDGGAGDIR